MKRTKNNLITIIIFGIVMTSLLIGAVAVTSFRNVIDKNNHEIMLLYGKENSDTMNKLFSEIETLVNTLSDYYVGQLESADALENDVFLADYTEEAKKVAYSVIQNNDSIVAAYLRFNPQITDPLSGFFISRTVHSDEPEYLVPTDLSKYDSSDIQNVGWYYIPVEKGEAVWLEPYENPNNGIYMISYVTPLYIQGELIGVLGIDLDYDAISDAVGKISLYKSGYAILMNSNGEITFAGNHNPVIPADTRELIISEQEEYIYSSYIEKQQFNIITSHKLKNGEYLVLIVPEIEIYSTRNQTMFTIILIAIAISTMVILILTGMVSRIMNATRVDKLTGAKNRNAYLEKISSIENAIHSNKSISFALVVFDVNGLKAVNDHIGHAEGDRLIINSYQAIKSAFPGVDVYRIGGDEFVVLIEKRTAAIAEKLVAKFRGEMSAKSVDYNKNPEEAIVSCGSALYNPETDASCEDTFNRADKEMYEDKQRFYNANPHLKRR